MRKLIQGIRNLWYWLPIIWRDRPWDYVYLLKIMKHKIEQMEKSIPEWFRVDAEEIQIEMLQAIQVIEDLISDRAERDAHIAHERIFGPSKHEMVKVEGKPLVEYRVSYPEADDDDVARRALMSFMEIAAMTHRITMDTFGRMLMRIDRWWD